MESGMGQTPLQGIKVIEMGTLIAAPFAARLMAEFGADVIKIESPQSGDPLRQWRKLYNGTSLWWYVQARNKKSVTVNIKKEAGQEIIRQLVKDADILIENFRLGSMEGWNLGWEQLSAINSGLIMVRISGYGQTGPYRDRPGFGAIGESIGVCVIFPGNQIKRRYVWGSPSEIQLRPCMVSGRINGFALP